MEANDTDRNDWEETILRCIYEDTRFHEEVLTGEALGRTALDKLVSQGKVMQGGLGVYVAGKNYAYEPPEERIEEPPAPPKSAWEELILRCIHEDGQFRERSIEGESGPGHAAIADLLSEDIIKAVSIGVYVKGRNFPGKPPEERIEPLPAPPKKERPPKTFQEKVNQILGDMAILVGKKNQVYGNAAGKTKQFLQLLYPEGVPVEAYDDMLLLVRVFDKQMRIATAQGQLDPLGEDPWSDILGYSAIACANRGPK